MQVTTVIADILCYSVSAKHCTVCFTHINSFILIICEEVGTLLSHIIDEKTEAWKAD